MRIVFMGTPDFAVPCLEKLINLNYEVVAVFTQPDKKKGRSYTVTAPPIKNLALKNNLKVFQPSNLKNEEVFNFLTSLKVDLIIVVAYGKILPKEILKIPRFGCINVHASLLPKYRGAAPIQWAIINGEKFTGVTTMYMDEGLDTGDIISTAETNIYENETSENLFNRLRFMGADLLIKTLDNVTKGKTIRKKQDNKKATYAPILNKTMSKINWNNNAEKIHNFVRGLNPWPIATTSLNGKNLKIYKTIVNKKFFGKPGEVKSLNPLVVACANNSAIEILELQLESKKRMTAENFLRGYQLKLGTILN